MSVVPHVSCDCIEKGHLTTPHPYPDLLVIDPVTGEPDVNSKDLTIVKAHDAWLNHEPPPCPHQGCRLSIHWWSIPEVAAMRQIVRELSPDPASEYTVLWSRVIFDGITFGTIVERRQVIQLKPEVERLRSAAAGRLSEGDASFLVYMLEQIDDLIAASDATGKPIVR